MGNSGEGVFETVQAEALSEALRSAERVVDGDMVDKWAKSWQKV